MKIEINRTKNKKLVIDETSTIINSYKKLFLNPYRKIVRISTRLIINILLLVIYLILLSLYTYFYDTNIVFPILIGIIAALTILKISRFIVYNSNLNKLSKINSNSELIIDEEKITLNKKTSNISCFVEWNEIKNVLITNNCIVFMKNTFNVKEINSIIIPRDYENEVIGALKKYKKLDLVIYNKR